MAKKSFRVGVLVSTTGSYGTVGKTIMNGVCLAARELRQQAPEISLELVYANPHGDNAQYFRSAEAMLRSGIRHVIGCYTSSSRKQLLPLFERFGGLLWYPAHYEGFEISDNVVYTGTAPNHHIHPMVDYMFSHHGRTAYCIGSDYIWAWESNRVFRDEFARRGGHVIGEKYVPIDGLDMSDTIEHILRERPAFVLNTLIGASSYHFFREFRKACRRNDIDQTRAIPVVSCNLSEADLREIGVEAVDGHLSSSVYFASADTLENKVFVQTYRATYPNECLPTVEAEAAYIATRFLGAGLAADPDGDVERVKQMALAYRFLAPQGEVYLDPLTFHTYLTPRIGRSTPSGEFEIVAESAGPVRPDPYLVGTSSELMLPSAGVGMGMS